MCVWVFLFFFFRRFYELCCPSVVSRLHCRFNALIKFTGCVREALIASVTLSHHTIIGEFQSPSPISLSARRDGVNTITTASVAIVDTGRDAANFTAVHSGNSTRKRHSTQPIDYYTYSLELSKCVYVTV